MNGHSKDYSPQLWNAPAQREFYELKLKFSLKISGLGWSLYLLQLSTSLALNLYCFYTKSPEAHSLVRRVHSGHYQSKNLQSSSPQPPATFSYCLPPHLWHVSPVLGVARPLSDWTTPFPLVGAFPLEKLSLCWSLESLGVSPVCLVSSFSWWLLVV